MNRFNVAPDSKAACEHACSDDAVRFAVGTCACGMVLVARSRRGVCAILLGDEPQVLERELRESFPHATPAADDAVGQNLLAQVRNFVDAPGMGLELPLDMHGTAFQQRVWQALRGIPVGGTASYSEIARRIGQPGAARAVARACASNLLAMAVPCHRVVRSNGDVSGYRWGAARKRALLEREASP